MMTFFQKHWFQIIFLLIVFLGACIRLHKLGEVPFSLYWDEAAMLVDAKSVAETGKDMHGNTWMQSMFPSYGDYKLPLYIWLASITVKLFGATEFALRLPSALAGIGQIIVVGLLAKEVLKQNKLEVAVVHQRILMFSCMLVIAISPWSILFSRTGFEGHVGQFFLLLSIFFLYRNAQIKKKLLKILCLVLVPILGAIAVYTYYSIRFVWPVVVLAFFLLQTNSVINFNFKSKRLIQIDIAKIAQLFFIIILWFALLTPLYKSPYYQPSQTFRLSTSSILNTPDRAVESNVLREMSGNTLQSRIFYHRYVLLLKDLLANYAEHINVNYLFLKGDSNLRHGTTQAGLFQIWMIVPFIVGIYSLAKKRIKILLFFVLWWLIALLPASIPTTVPHALRSLNALLPLVMIIGFGMGEILKFIINSTWLRKTYKIRTVIFTATVLTPALLTGIFLHDYFAHYPSRSAVDWQDGYKQLALFIHERRSPVRTVWVNSDDNRLYLWLMIYGQYRGEQFWQFPRENYMISEIDNVVFETFDWLKLETLDHRLIVVERPGNLKGTPNWMEEIRDHAGEVRFVVAEYGK